MVPLAGPYTLATQTEMVHRVLSDMRGESPFCTADFRPHALIEPMAGQVEVWATPLFDLDGEEEAA